MFKESSSLIIVNARVITLDDAHPVASGIAVEEGQIVAVGSEAEVMRFVSKNSIVWDLQGKVVIPGLIDAHFHLVYYGLSRGWLDLSDAKSMQDLRDLVKAKMSRESSDSWIYGIGWRVENLVEGRTPMACDLDQVAPNQPVMLSRADGHASVVNTQALKAAGITSKTKDPSGGRIDRDGFGNPNGLLHEGALYLVWGQMMQGLSINEFQTAAVLACEDAVSRGITSAHAILLEDIPLEVMALERLADEGKLPLRLVLFVPLEAIREVGNRSWLPQNPRVKLAGVKLFADGALGPATAALRQPYHHLPNNSGMLNYTDQEMVSLVHEAYQEGFQIAIHSTGDRAIAQSLFALEQVVGNNHDVRPRIEHAVVLPHDLMERVDRLGGILSVQPRGVGPRLEARLGPERIEWAGPWKTALERGLHLAGGTDCPFIQPLPDVIEGMRWAVKRGGFQIQQALSPEEALKLYTTGSAYASGDESHLGSIKIGNDADLVVLSEDPRDYLGLDKTQVEMTIVGGQVVYITELLKAIIYK